MYVVGGGGCISHFPNGPLTRDSCMWLEEETHVVIAKPRPRSYALLRAHLVSEVPRNLISLDISKIAEILDVGTRYFWDDSRYFPVCS